LIHVFLLPPLVFSPRLNDPSLPRSLVFFAARQWSVAFGVGCFLLLPRWFWLVLVVVSISFYVVSPMLKIARANPAS
jgi:hypothetical protein